MLGRLKTPLCYMTGRAKKDLSSQKSCESLPSGGLIIMREVLLDDEKGGPAIAAAYSLSMLLATEGGQQYSRAEL